MELAKPGLALQARSSAEDHTQHLAPGQVVLKIQIDLSTAYDEQGLEAEVGACYDLKCFRRTTAFSGWAASCSYCNTTMAAWSPLRACVNSASKCSTVMVPAR
jgi:hypothetical protein